MVEERQRDEPLIRLEGAEGRVAISREWQGSWTPGYETVDVTFCGIGSAEAELAVTVDGEELAAARGDDGRYRVKVPRDFKSVAMSWAPVEVGEERTSNTELRTSNID
jgi:hypothetical protein